MEKCNCYHAKNSDSTIGECWGTKGCELTDCQGDKKWCNFYPEIREQAYKEAAQTINSHSQYLTRYEIIEIVNDAAYERGKKVPCEFYERLIKC